MVTSFRYSVLSKIFYCVELQQCLIYGALMETVFTKVSHE